MKIPKACALMLALALLTTGCRDSQNKPDSRAAVSSPPTNRILVSVDIQANLGITWATARRGRLEHRVLIPGELVAPPDRRWTIRAPLSGTIGKIAARWHGVKAGDVVAELISPDLASIQAELYGAMERAEEARMAVRMAAAEAEPEKALAQALERAARDAHDAEARASVALEVAGSVSRAAEAMVIEQKRLAGSEAVSRVALLSAQRDALELRRGALAAERVLRVARVESRKLALEAVTAQTRVSASARRLKLIATRVASAEAAFEQRLSSLAAATGMTIQELSTVNEGGPLWASMRSLPLRAPAEAQKQPTTMWRETRYSFWLVHQHRYQSLMALN